MSITVNNITKQFGSQKALNKVSFKVGNGEVVGFLGPNGAGKSTLMKILTGYLTPDEGSAEVCGMEIDNKISDIQRQIGYLPEHNPLYTDMFVREYLKFNASVYNIDKSRLEEVIQLTGLTPEANKKIEQLSKGYRQRVGLAAALLHDPQVLILDEPTTGLDPNQLVEIRSLIRNMGKPGSDGKPGKTVFLSTHIMQEVEAICNRVIIINKGKIVADMRLQDLREENDQVVFVEFDYRIEEIALQNLPHLKSAKNTGGFTYELIFNTKKDMRPAVFDFAHDNGLKTLQLNQKTKNLESIFAELTNS